MQELIDPVIQIANNDFNIDYLFPYQRLVIANILDCILPDAESLRQIVLLPTGFGKSLCFQLPASMLPGPTIIIYPLLALMDDQQRRLASLHIPCALFRGAQSREERKAEEDKVQRGAKIIITNPETLKSEKLLSFLKEVKVSHLAIDEAHCVYEWGTTFRPSYLDLKDIINTLQPPALSAFTATASPLVFQAVANLIFGSTEYKVISGNPDRPNLHYSVAQTLSKEHSLEMFARSLPRPMLVFSSSRDGVQIIARVLRERLNDTEIKFYHAGLERDEKTFIEKWFFDSPNGILVSTCAYGMGVDKKNIRSVVHFEIPSSIESYLQEAGRAGRDGKPSWAILIIEPDTKEKKALPTLDAEEVEVAQQFQRRRIMEDYASLQAGCRRAYLLQSLGSPTSTEESDSPCSGCDLCDTRTVPAILGLEELLVFIAKNKRRFSTENAVRIMRSTQGSTTEPPCCFGYGSFKEWDKNDTIHAIEIAIARGDIKKKARWPWKHTLTVGIIG